MTAPTDVDTELDQQTVEQLTPPCEVRELNLCLIHGIHTHPCDRPAAWIIRTTCTCSAVETALVCDPHLGPAQTDSFRFICTTCGAINQIASTCTEKL